MAKDVRGAKPAPPQSQEPRPKPVHEIRLGRIKAAIWRNDTETGVRHNVTVSRLYKDGDAWKRSDSFGREDLPLVAKVADLAHTWIFQQGQTDGPPEGPGAQPGGDEIPF
jgi:hypothetical protein